MLLELLEQTLPEWMFQPARRQWSTLMAAVAVTFDALVEGVYQARLGSMPGQVDASVAPNMGGFLMVDALGAIGRDRRIVRGLAERPEDYALALRQWLQIWAQSATPWMLLQQLQRVLGGATDAGYLRIITANGDWWTLGPSSPLITLQRQGAPGFYYNPFNGTCDVNDGTFVHAWNWDSTSSPPPFDQNDSSRCWLVAYTPVNTPFELGNDATFADPGVVDDFWNNVTTSGAGAGPDSGVVGLSCPLRWVDRVRLVVSEMKAAGLPFAYAIVSFDPAAFNPTGDSTPTSIPDGNWGWHAKFNPSTHYREIARFVNADYIAAPPGGVRP